VGGREVRGVLVVRGGIGIGVRGLGDGGMEDRVQRGRWGREWGGW